MTRKRNNAYYEGRLKRDFPLIHADFVAGEYPSLRQALIAAGLKKERSGLNRLKAEWQKATAKEKADFLRWVSTPASPSSSSISDSEGRLRPQAAARIQIIMKRRSLEMGDLLSELKFNRRDPSIGLALRQNSRLRSGMLRALERWLHDNRSI